MKKEYIFLLLIFIFLSVIVSACGNKNERLGEDSINEFPYYGNWNISAVYQLPQEVYTVQPFETEQVIISDTQFSCSSMIIASPIYEFVTFTNDDLRSFGIDELKIEFDFTSETTGFKVKSESSKDECIFLITQKGDLLYVREPEYIFIVTVKHKVT